MFDAKQARETKAYGLFKEQCSAFIQKLQGLSPSSSKGAQSLRDPDVRKELHRELHQIKGAAGMFGHQGLADQCKLLDDSLLADMDLVEWIDCEEVSRLLSLLVLNEEE